VFRLTLKGVATNKVRYWLTGLAILIGVAFIAGTLVFTDTIRDTFNGLFSDIYQGTAAVVRGEQFSSTSQFFTERRPIPESLIGPVEHTPGVQAAAVSVSGYAQLVGSNGKPIGNPGMGAPTLGEAWTPIRALSQAHLLPGGHPPRSPSQVVIDKHAADVGHLKVGQQVTVLTQRSPKRYTITGIILWGTADSPLGATLTYFDLPTAQRVLGQPGKVSQIEVQAAPGYSEDQVVHNLKHVLQGAKGVQVVSGTQVIAESQNNLGKTLGFLNSFLLVFALVALFVGAFLIYNTFSIVLAQRQRELALLRAIGASRRQVLRFVVGESAVVGVVASGVGLAAGLGLAVLLRAGMAALGFAIPATGLVVQVRTVIVALVVGTVVTVVSAYVPARRAANIPPTAAMAQATVEQPRHSLARSVTGVAITAFGALAIGLGLFTKVNDRALVVGVGAALFFLGVAALGPVVARPLAVAIGAPFSKMGVTGQLGRLNAMRNPRRTSSTAAALMIGVALVSLMTIIAASTKSSIDAAVDASVKADFIITPGTNSSNQAGLSPTLAAAVSRLPQVSTAAGIQVTQVSIQKKTTYLVSGDPRTVDQLVNLDVKSGHMSSMSPDGIAVSTQVAGDRHLHLGSPVTVVFPETGPKVFHVQAVYGARTVAGDYVLPTAAVWANTPERLDAQIYVKLAPGVSTTRGRAAVEKVLAPYPTAKLLDQTQYKAELSGQVDQLLNLIYGLLLLAVVIALIGIANTLALSVHERTHELGILRAVGMTRRQLRDSVRAESAIISLLGTAEGLGIGILFGWAMVTALSGSGVNRLSIPVPQLVVLVVFGGLAGVLAARGPSRRAAKLNVLEAIATE
jgi:putative ABC transport system permease protein